jgi:uncharacterized membrane protein
VRAWLQAISEPVILAIDAVALLVIVVGTVQVLIRVMQAAVKPLPAVVQRETWLRYARWLVAALTFQLAADIIETSITTDWQTIGRVGAIAVIRTFLNYFLERDVEKQQRDCAALETRGEAVPAACNSPASPLVRSATRDP